MHWCKKCDSLLFDDDVCSCVRFMVFYEYCDEGGHEQYGFYFEDAAERFAKWYNQDDYPLMDESMEIEIVNEDDEKKKFKIGAEPDILYWTEEIKDESE